jgi:hypothetical protein
MILADDHQRILEAIQTAHRVEVGKLGMQLALYRAALEDAGIEPPDKDGEELLRLWRGAARVVTSASDFASDMGSAKELWDPNLTVTITNTAA